MFQGEGFANDFQAAMEKVDQDYLDEIIKATGGKDAVKSTDVSVKDDGTTQEDLMVRFTLKSSRFFEI